MSRLSRVTHTESYRARSLVSLVSQAKEQLTATELSQLIQENLTPDEAIWLSYDWRGLWARPEQLEPDWHWTIWLLLAGRGFGKTRTGAEWVRARVESGRARRIALIGKDAADVRDTMVEGPDGILSVCPPWNRPTYVPSKRRLTWPNGAIAITYSAEEPDQLRGPQHDTGWCDELAKWRYLDTWDQFLFGLRMGSDPRACITTTPRPIALIRELLKDKTVHPTRGSTYDNRANLPQTFFDKVVARYEGTRMGRQELNAEVLDDITGALWNHVLLDAMRRKPKECPDYARVVVAIDPAATSGEESDETGLTVTAKGVDGHGYVLADESGRYAPNEWGMKAIALYRNFSADVIVAETNNGGEMVENTLRAIDPDVPFKAVTASRGKVTRAEPVSALYEQKKVHHVGAFPQLEDQMCIFTSDFDRKKAGFSPDRVDSLVWGLTELMLGDNSDAILEWARQQSAEREAEKARGVKLIKMRAPEGVSTVYLSDGGRLNVVNGHVEVKEVEVIALRRAGFKEV